MDPAPPAAQARPFPLWTLVLGGLLAASAWRARPSRGEVPGEGRAGSARDLLERGSARDLRALPGIGERRALDLVEARWRRGPDDPPLYLHDLPGVGSALAAAVRAALDRAPDAGRDSP